MILKAKMEDLKEIMKIIKKTVKSMNKEGNIQWDSNYPKEENFIKDIENQTLYIIKENKDIEKNKKIEIIMGLICIDNTESEEYKELSWASDEKCMVIHRMAVNPDYKRQGIGSKLIELAEEIAKENNIKYLKTDTFSDNKKMMGLFEKCGFSFVGEMKFIGYEKPFYSFEKLLKKNKK